jgi:sensor histidine kinase YesM
MEYVFVISDEGKLLNLVPDNLLQRNLRLNYAFKPWFVEAMTSGGTVFSEMDFLETEKGLSILISTPIIDNYGVIKGVIGCGLDHLAIDNFLKPPRLSEKDMFLLLDKNNMVLKQSGVGEINVDESDIGFKNPFLIDWAPEKLKKDQGSTIWKKQGVIYSFCEIENLNWKVVVQTPIKEAFKKINFTRNMFLLFVLLVVGVSLVLSIVFVSKLLPPLEELKKGLNRLAIGDFDFRIKVSAQKEFRELVSDFNAMAVKLQETILKLRSKSR